MVAEKSTLGDLIDSTNGSIQTGPFGTKLKASEYTRTGVPVISVGEVGFGRIRLHEKTPKVDNSIWERMPEYLLRTDDIVFGRKGAVERSAHIQPNEDGYFLGSDGIRVRLNPDECEPKFIAYQFQSEAHKAWMIQHAAGTTMPSLNEGIIRRIPIVVPPLPEQKAIAHILGTLDDKIDLNRRMNATLEGMAQAHFKSWFVDFDPVIDNALAAGNPIPDELAARAEVRRQALANGTANREAAEPFPAAFQETEELGWIPEGWEVSSIGEECETVGGGTPSTKNPDFWEGGEYPWVTPKDFSALQDKVLLSSSRFLTREGLNKVSSGLLPIGTVLMSSRAPVGYLAITQIETAINQGFIAMLCNGKLPSEYILQWANSRMDDIKQASSGSTFAEISKKGFRPFRVIVPSGDLIESYTKTIAPIYARITANVAESETLSVQRDTLLPKLISGELRLDA